MNGGPVLKINNSLRYATDAPGAAAFVLACEQADVPMQRFVTRSDMPCGSTVGPTTAASLGVTTVDFGAPTLAMHSAREMCGADDMTSYVAALAAFLAPAADDGALGERPVRRAGEPGVAAPGRRPRERASEPRRGGTPPREPTRPSTATFLRDDGFVWCPEGLDEADVHLLGDVRGATGARGRVRRRAVRALAHQAGRRRPSASTSPPPSWSGRSTLDGRTGTAVPTAVADVGALPFADASFDLACSAFGAIAVRQRRAGRAGRGGARAAARWAVRLVGDPPDAVGVPRRPRVRPGSPSASRTSTAGRTWRRTSAAPRRYAEHHRTMGDWVRAIVGAGLRLDDVIEPAWPDGLDHTWGQWSPLRGRLMPGTAIFVTAVPA